MKPKIIALITVLLFALLVIPARAQETITRIPPQDLICGGKPVADEFTVAREERTYTINAVAGTTISISIKAIAQQPQMFAFLTDRTNFPIAMSTGRMRGNQTICCLASPQTQINLDQIILAATGEYTLRLLNTGFRDYVLASDEYFIYPENPRGGIGAFNVTLECIGPDGRPIILDEPIPAPEPTVAPQPSFSFGMPTIPAQDFSVGVTLPLQFDVANSGSISPGFQGIIGYTFAANAGDNVTLTFNREQGNLSLGLAVIAEDNTLVFQTTLAGASNLTVAFSAPATGTYTIGVYVTNISAPAAPENTRFTIQGAVGS